MSHVREKVKHDILSQFSECQLRAGLALPLNWLDLGYVPELSEAGRTEVEPAIRELEDEGLITTHRVFILTEKGEAALKTDQGTKSAEHRRAP